MKLKTLSLVAAVLLVAACQQTPAATDNAGANTSNTGSTTGTDVGGFNGALQKVGNTIYFAFNESNITAESRLVLQRQAQLLQQNASATVTIEGHCDERGTVEYNLGLGERRANATKQALIALGVSANRVNIISYGKERPATLGHNDQAWAQNRRAVTVAN